MVERVIRAQISSMTGFWVRAERDRGQDGMLPGSSAPGREPLEHNRKNDDEHKTEPEDRHGDTEKGHGCDQIVDPCVGPYSRNNAGRDTEEAGQDDCNHGQQGRVW